MFKPARRFLISAIAAALTLATGVTALPHEAAAMSQTSPKYAAIVIDAHSGEVLYASRADSPRYPASITKVMTLYLAFEALEQGKLRTDERIVISPRAAAQAPSKLGLRAGDTISVDDAIRALAVKSANDIAVALAERIGGTESRFAALMTLRAEELGMNQTRFVNANGLPDSRQISSARDIALLSRAVMRDYPQYYGYFSQRYFSYRGSEMRNHNRLLHNMPGVDGIKTGFTNASGFNLAASAVRDGRRLIAVVMGGATSSSRDNHAQELLNAGFQVITRRARGENIQMASLIEPQRNTAYAAVGGSFEQGSHETPRPVEPRERSVRMAALQIEEAAEPKKKPAPEKKVAKAEPKKGKAAAKDEDDKPSKKAKGGDWIVQVGAFAAKDDAKTQLSKMAKKYAALDKDDGEVIKADGKYRYRVRFGGFTKDEAQKVCKSVKKDPCLALRAG
ncbi:MAG TPA: D-alanyl-D-alanine carboxypeptidase [Caulobacteraceae bacterium]|jgi:D-alanyl-D-alanine carboxypeptidase (penicillin-binding protein 5/6)